MAAPDERDTRQRDHPPLLEKDEPGHPAGYRPTAIPSATMTRLIARPPPPGSPNDSSLAVFAARAPHSRGGRAAGIRSGPSCIIIIVH
jgi:hypothetical protein